MLLRLVTHELAKQANLAQTVALYTRKAEGNAKVRALALVLALVRSAVPSALYAVQLCFAFRDALLSKLQ